MHLPNASNSRFWCLCSHTVSGSLSVKLLGESCAFFCAILPFGKLYSSKLILLQVSLEKKGPQRVTLVKETKKSIQKNKLCVTHFFTPLESCKSKNLADELLTFLACLSLVLPPRPRNEIQLHLLFLLFLFDRRYSQTWSGAGPNFPFNTAWFRVVYYMQILFSPSWPRFFYQFTESRLTGFDCTTTY